MKLIVNGEACDVPTAANALSIAQLLVHLGLTDGPVAVEVNRAIVPRAEHEAHALREGDALEIVHMVGGG